MTLVQIAFSMLAAGACGGLLFTLLIALKVRYPRWFGAAHGLIGLSALGVLGYALSHVARPIPDTALWAVGLLGSAGCGGLVLFRLMKPKGSRLGLALLHGSLALAGVYLLYRFTAA
ncbi:hypothetical protein [Aquabacterium sp.]|uniref:hypothetical protein n=1 Tax=Aquabacterium sp. TaxID=1872578 RepID=UPI0025BCC71A|nr:hypothetical protein [Aquabacterium sp.]